MATPKAKTSGTGRAGAGSARWGRRADIKEAAAHHRRTEDKQHCCYKECGANVYEDQDSMRASCGCDDCLEALGLLKTEEGDENGD